MSRKDFIDEIGGLIVDECIDRGYKFPSMMIAQACLESAYGLSKLATEYYNYFGMKCGSSWKGKSVNMATFEEVDGKNVDVRDNFRVYSSMKAGVKGYFAFIKASRYANLKYAKSALEYGEMIKADGWATDSTYVNKLLNISVLYGLDFFDDIVAGKIKNEDIDDIVNAVIRGEYGNGEDRKRNLERDGWNYAEVQRLVNAKLRNDMTEVTADLDDVARRVIRGDFGNGKARVEALTAAGYDAKAVQKRVNEILKG